MMWNKTKIEREGRIQEKKMEPELRGSLFSRTTPTRTQLARDQRQRQNEKMEPQTYEKRGLLFSPPRLYLGVPNLADTNNKYPL